MAAYLFILYAIAATLVSLHRFWQYEVFYFDFGIFDQAIWYASRLQPPVIEHLVVPGKWIFADHFSPTIFLLSPLYWLTSRQEVLLIAQALAVALSGLVLYHIGLRVLKQGFLSFAVMVSYLLFVGLQNAIITDFHEVTVGTLPLMLLLWSYVARRQKLFWLFLLLTLGIKESTAILGAALGLTILLTDKKWRRIGFVTLIVSILWGLIATKLIIPYFAGKPYGYSPVLPSGLWGNITGLFDEAIKRKTLLYSFGSFLFLPLLYPPAWLLILQDLFVRFVPKDTNLRWDLGLHYSAQLAPVLGYATVMGLRRRGRLVAVFLVATAVFLHQFKLHGPLGLAYNPAFYAHTKNFAFLNRLVSQIPKERTVMAQNNLATRFAHQPVYLLRKNYWDWTPEYIVIDARDGQNPNNFFGIKDYKGIKDVEEIIDALQSDPLYRIIYQTEKQYVFQRSSVVTK
ncbi:DUF2079 domain-containing protein [Candidatus Gottesmanbacteria bacterium]|nr:DUF2079 domain-containing protein [Candidatus Gottesmanbacteria bacterium]